MLSYLAMTHETPTLIPAATLPRNELADLINRAYADYYIAVHMTPQRLAEMCAEETIDLQKSVVALRGQVPAGLAFLSIRGAQGWISGVGVRPEWRRQGIAHHMIRHLQATARADGLQSLWLEVLTQNTAGATLYRRLGFEWVRELLVLSAEAQQLAAGAYPPQVNYTSPATLLESYAAFHDVRAPWQRDLPSLRGCLETLHGLGYWEDRRLVGYVLYQIGETDYTLYDLAVAPAHPQRLAVAESLLMALHAARTDLGSYIINVPADDPLASAFLSLNYRIWHRQHEMRWQVK